MLEHLACLTNTVELEADEERWRVHARKLVRRREARDGRERRRRLRVLAAAHAELEAGEGC